MNVFEDSKPESVEADNSELEFKKSNENSNDKNTPVHEESSRSLKSGAGNIN